MSFTPLQPHWPLPLLHYFCNVPSIPEEPSSINRAWQRSGTDCANSQACCLKADGGESIPALFPKSLLPANRESSKQERGTGAQGCSHLGALLAAPGRVPCLQGVLSPRPCCSAGAGNKNTGCPGGSGFRGTAGKRRCSDSLREEKKKAVMLHQKTSAWLMSGAKQTPPRQLGSPGRQPALSPWQDRHKWTLWWEVQPGLVKSKRLVCAKGGHHPQPRATNITPSQLALPNFFFFLYLYFHPLMVRHSSY